MPRFRLTLAYDGTVFAGSQVQPNQRTVQGELESVLQALVEAPVRTVFAGRTDRGVHALGQVVAVDLASWRGTAADLARALNAGLPADVAAKDVVLCDATFNPRFDAVWREYRYWIAPGAVDPFLRRYAWRTRSDVALGPMVEAAGHLVGTFDFASFAGGGEGVPWSKRAQRATGTVRTVYRCDCREIFVNAGPNAQPSARVLETRIAANGFLPRMVRNIVGALVEIGQARQDAAWLRGILEARDRRAGSVVAPAQGLTLWKVGYGSDLLDDW